MKTEEEIREEFDEFINRMDNMMSDISGSFHKHDDMVGWDKTSQSAINKLQKHLPDFTGLLWL